LHKLPCDVFDCGDDVTLGLGLGVVLLVFGEGKRGEHRARPGAEILRRKILLRDLLDVGVDVAGIDRARFLGFIEILEQLMTSDVGATPDN
jgi:hypothetical protein